MHLPDDLVLSFKLLEFVLSGLLLVFFSHLLESVPFEKDFIFSSIIFLGTFSSGTIDVSSFLESLLKSDHVGDAWSCPVLGSKASRMSVSLAP